MAPQDVPPASLAELIELDVEPRRVWRADELGAVLLHELSLPLSVALGELTLGAVEEPGGDAEFSLRPTSLGTLLHHPHPPLELLQRVKDAAKTARHDPRSQMPEDVAAVLYAMAIAAALLRHGRRITAMTHQGIRESLAWAASRPWLDIASRRLLCQAQDHIAGSVAS